MLDNLMAVADTNNDGVIDRHELERAAALAAGCGKGERARGWGDGDTETGRQEGRQPCMLPTRVMRMGRRGAC
jgi:hypothetical protein